MCHRELHPEAVVDRVFFFSSSNHLFCSTDHLLVVLRAGRYEVTHLLRLLQLTLDWEEQHTRFFRRLYGDGSAPGRTVSAATEQDGEDDRDDEEQASCIDRDASTASSTAAAADANLGHASPWHYEPSFHARISGAFTPYLGAYVELERSNVRQLLERIAQEEVRVLAALWRDVGNPFLFLLNLRH